MTAYHIKTIGLAHVKEHVTLVWNQFLDQFPVMWCLEAVPCLEVPRGRFFSALVSVLGVGVLALVLRPSALVSVLGVGVLVLVLRLSALVLVSVLGVGVLALALILRFGVLVNHCQFRQKLDMVWYNWCVICTAMYSLVSCFFLLCIFSFLIRCIWADLPEINLIDRSIDWLIDWLIDWIAWFIDWLIGLIVLIGLIILRWQFIALLTCTL